MSRVYVNTYLWTNRLTRKMNGAPELKTANHHATRALNEFCIIRNVEFSRFAQIVIASA